MRVAFVAALLFSALACTTGTGLARCGETGARGTVCASLGREFDIRLGETAYIADTRLSVRANSVPEDSRCPQDVVCAWAGNARVSLTMRDGTNSEAADVNSTLEPHAVTRFGYTVRLIDVRPGRLSSQPVNPQAYVIRLVVTRAAS